MSSPTEGGAWTDGDKSWSDENESWGDGQERWVDGDLESGADEPTAPLDPPDEERP